MRDPLKSMVYHDGELEVFASGAVRKNYSRHHPRIATIADLKATLRAGQYTGVGGYPLFLICADGETLSFEAARENFKRICAEMGDAPCYDKQWRIVACDINYEDADMVCAHTGKKIPCAYE